jgi:hypothetical protein
MKKGFERNKRMLAAGLALSIGSMGLSAYETPADASNKSVTTTTIAGNKVKGLYLGAKLNIVKIVHPVNGKNIESTTLSSDPDSDNNGEDLVVFYSEALSQEMLRTEGSQPLGISIGFLFTDRGKKDDVVESLILFDTKSLVVQAFSSGKTLKSNWQPMYSQAAIGDQPPLNFQVTDRAVNIHDHRGVEILIKNIKPTTQTD